MLILPYFSSLKEDIPTQILINSIQITQLVPKLKLLMDYQLTIWSVINSIQAYL